MKGSMQRELQFNGLMRLIVALFLVATSLQAQQKNNFVNHVLFKHLIGEWRSEGVLKSEDGKEIKIKEEWRGSVSGENAFLLEGKRELDGDSQAFQWLVMQNTSTGFYETTHSSGASGGDSQRFETVVSEADLTLQLSAPMGDNGSNLTVQFSFPLKDKKNMDTMEAKVAITGEKGAITLSGVIKHQRVKAP